MPPTAEISHGDVGKIADFYIQLVRRMVHIHGQLELLLSTGQPNSPAMVMESGEGFIRAARKHL